MGPSWADLGCLVAIEAKTVTATVTRTGCSGIEMMLGLSEMGMDIETMLVMAG